MPLCNLTKLFIEGAAEGGGKVPRNLVRRVGFHEALMAEGHVDRPNVSNMRRAGPGASSTMGDGTDLTVWWRQFSKAGHKECPPHGGCSGNGTGSETGAQQLWSLRVLGSSFSFTLSPGENSLPRCASVLSPVRRTCRPRACQG